MAFVKMWRGQLKPYPGEFDESLLLQEVPLEDYLDQRYPQSLLEVSDSARSYKEKERTLLQAEIEPGDGLWEWSEGEWPFQSRGLAVKREGKLVRVWLTYMEF
jgi:hypothetical protein